MLEDLIKAIINGNQGKSNDLINKMSVEELNTYPLPNLPELNWQQNEDIAVSLHISHLALRCKRTETLKLLIEKGVDTSSPNFYKKTPLWTSVLLNQKDAFDLLLEKAKSDEFTKIDQENKNILMHAKGEAIAKKLIERGADLYYRTTYGDNVLSIRGQSYEMIEFFLNQDKSKKLIDQDDKDGLTPVLSTHNKDIALLLLKAGASIEFVTKSKETIFSKAIDRGWSEVIKFLLENEKILKIINQPFHDGFTPLGRAVVKGHDHLVKILVDKGVDPNSKLHTPQNNQTLLHYISWYDTASYFQKPSVAEALISCGANVETCSSSGVTPMSNVAYLANDLPLTRQFAIGLIINKLAANSNDISREEIEEIDIQTREHDWIMQSINFRFTKYGIPQNYDVSKYNRLFSEEFIRSLNTELKDRNTVLKEIKLETLPTNPSVGKVDKSFNSHKQDRFTKSIIEGEYFWVREHLKEISLDSLNTRLEYNPEHTQKSKHTALQIAAKYNHPNIIILLLKAGATITSVNDGCEEGNILHIAAAAGSVKALKLLLNQDEAKPLISQKNQRGETPLMLSKNVGIAKLLVNHGASPDEVAENGWSALSFAAEKGKIALLKFLLDCADKSLVNKESIASTTPLIIAKTSETALVLIQAGADVNHVTSKGTTALQHAASNGDHTRIKFLLEHKANPNHIYQGKPLLSLAATEEIALMLLKAGIDVKSQDFSKVPYVLIALKAKWIKVLDQLLAMGAKVDGADEEGATPLMLALRSADLDFVKKLLAKGASLSAKDKKGKKAIDYAKEAKDSDINNLPKIIEFISKIKDGKELTEEDFEKISSMIFQKPTRDLISAIIENDSFYQGGLKNCDLSKYDKLPKLFTDLFKGSTSSPTKSLIDGNSSSITTSSRQNNSTLEELMKLDNDSLNKPYKNSKSPLEFAVENSHVPSIHYLVERGAELNRGNLSFQETLLTFATRYSTEETIIELLICGLNVGTCYYDKLLRENFEIERCSKDKVSSLINFAKYINYFFANKDLNKNTIREFNDLFHKLEDDNIEEFISAKVSFHFRQKQALEKFSIDTYKDRLSDEFIRLIEEGINKLTKANIEVEEKKLEQKNLAAEALLNQQSEKIVTDNNNEDGLNQQASTTPNSNNLVLKIKTKDGLVLKLSGIKADQAASVLGCIKDYIQGYSDAGDSSEVESLGQD